MPPSSSVRDDILALTEAATAVAVSVLLGNLRLLELPSGGSITLACVPLLAFAALRGVRRGLFVCTCAGFAHAASGGTIIHPVQLLLDYGVSYAAYALAGCARRSDGWALRCAIIAAGVVSLAATSVSGAIFFAQGFATTQGAVTFSVLYNVATIGPEVLLAIALVPLAARAIIRADPARAPRSAAARMSTAPRPQPRRAPVAPAAVLPARALHPHMGRGESHPLPRAGLAHEGTHAAGPLRTSPRAAALTRPAPFTQGWSRTRSGT